eukprot:GCRY01003279.1.p1 GENE.GCRY01003279.1~~GCRY01003279.1.p1  ORF type:complete len:256 (+),score=45.52 GCRY01003279.1:151-918(+)
MDRKELDVTRSGNRIWLVKVPKFMANNLRQNGANRCVGELRISQQPSTAQTPAVSLLLHDEHQKGPKQFVMGFTQGHPDTKIFSADSEENMAIDGTVEYMCSLRPLYTKEYQQLTKNRTIESSRPTRSTQEAGPQKQNVIKYAGPSIDGSRKRQREETVGGVGVPEKRERMDRQLLIERLMRLFESTQRWTFKELNAVVRQPEVFLKEVLGDIAVFHKRGKFKNHYELNENYRLHHSDDEADSGTPGLASSVDKQ